MFFSTNGVFAVKLSKRRQISGIYKLKNFCYTIKSDFSRKNIKECLSKMEFKVRKDFKTQPFSVPSEIVDSHIKLAGALQLRVILYCLRHTYDGDINIEAMAELFSVSKEDITDALMFWAELGFIECEGPKIAVQPKAEKPSKVAPPKTPRPTRNEVARRGLESPEVGFLLNEAQHKFGRGLKQSESSVLVWLYDDLGMDASLILMVMEYARQAERFNISYIEKVAKDWVDSGIDSIAAAEKRITQLNNSRTAWWKMRSAFGLDERAPNDTEAKLAEACIIEWKMSEALLKKAYDACIDSVGKYKPAYIKKVLSDWHKNGITKPEDLEKQTTTATNAKNKKTSGMATYDLSLLDEIINGD